MQQTSIFERKTAAHIPELDAARRLVRASLDFNEIYSIADLDGELMSAIDDAIKTADPKLIGEVIGALVTTYVEVIAHRMSCVEYDGPTEVEAVNLVMGRKQ